MKRGPISHIRTARGAVLAVCLSGVSLVLPLTSFAQTGGREGCRGKALETMRSDPTPAELRCRFGVTGPGRFGLLSYLDVPVYQPATPMPGTHLIGVAGHARPTFMETFEQWEWRILRTEFGSDAHLQHRSLDLLHPAVAELVRVFEQRLSDEGIRFTRRETWRTPARQAYLFQQGRSRPGPLATSTLTSWHAQMDSLGVQPAGRAVDYDVPASSLAGFHAIAAEVGLRTFGHDSHDPGHVFLPDLGSLSPLEAAVLRTLPRVPEVTLATGLPVDRFPPPGGRQELRARTLTFISEPFVPMPMARVSGRLSFTRAGPRHLGISLPTGGFARRDAPDHPAAGPPHVVTR